MLDFIRAYIFGYWKLHLQTFAKMFPWFRTYDHLNYARWAPVYYADMLSLEQSAPGVYQEFVGAILLLRKLMEHSIRFPLTKLLNGSTNYVSCPTALLVSPKLTVHEIVSASHGERGLLFLKQQSICSVSEMKTNLSQLARIVSCPEHQTMKLMSSHWLNSSNDLAYFLCVDQKLLP